MLQTICPHELPRALDHAPPGVNLLSLDCFDTLLWRDCHAPADVFAALPGLLPGQRARGEANARKAMSTLKRRNEVTLDDIYAQVMPNADAAMRTAAIAAELEAEARACFAFEPTADLMRAAKARGMTVIIVSDTYLSAAQLRDLIAESAGEEVAGLIDRVFASSDAGISKGEGLLGKAIKAMKARPHEVLHIGDNPKADFESARALGIPALHLQQFEKSTDQRLRLERTCHRMAPGEQGQAEPRMIGLQPHRALLALGEPQLANDAAALGYSVLGPLFYAYDRWLQGEAEALQNVHGGKVHWLFMLRDGHLPDLVHSAGTSAASEGPTSKGRVEISRFVATAASLITREAYHRHLALEHGLNPATLARQMLMDDEEITRIVRDPQSEIERAEASERLLTELRRGQRQKITSRRARAMANGMIQHVRAAVNPQPGDTLMLVDLGYNGSAQNAIDAVLSEALDVHVAGRYLICRELSATGLDKSGLIDTRHFDPGLLEAMCSAVAVIEQLATCELGSVIGYGDDGSPIRKQSQVKGAQSTVRDEVQDAVVQFVHAARRNPAIRTANVHEARGWRDCAAQVLTRFLFLPDTKELEVLKSFEHDVNLGSERMVALFDQEDACDAMKRRGLFYMKGSSRMFLPADLAREDMSTRLALLTQKRFGLGLTYTDYTTRIIEVPAFHVGAAQSAATTIEARPTHDGYYVARIPLSSGVGAVALQIGAVCKWVEVAGITRARLVSLQGKLDDEGVSPCRTVEFDGLHEHAPGVYECLSENALIMVVPEALENDLPGTQMVEIAFRPILSRSEARQGDASDMIPDARTAQTQAVA